MQWTQQARMLFFIVIGSIFLWSEYTRTAVTANSEQKSDIANLAEFEASDLVGHGSDQVLVKEETETFPETSFEGEAPAENEISYKKDPMVFSTANGNLTGRLQIKFKPEWFTARNANLLNNNAHDWISFMRHTIDVNLGLSFGTPCYGMEVAEFFGTLRNKAIWGNPESIARTTVTKIKLLEAVDSGHAHNITRMIFWLRELWLKFAINEAFGWEFDTHHWFTLGAFPFELGRGISLGAAYAVNPGVLGFFSDNTIDQYAFGFKINGDLYPKVFTYDLYGAILQNKCDSYNAVGEKIYGQAYGRLLSQERGPGHINYVIATRLKWFARETETTTIVFEPYWLFNRDPEQKIEFLADASSRLGTVGLAAEFLYGDFEWGFDTARNMGGQHVLGWDRNEIEKENREGCVAIVNSQVVTEDPTVEARPSKALYDPNTTLGKEVQRIIDSAARSAEQNGKFIGTATDGERSVNLFNSLNRFRDPYNNKFKGWMFVTDAAYWFCNRTLRLAAGAGVASGDENPNKDYANPNDSNVDGDYKGFIPLQEIYTGERIQSVFLLGGAGRIPRPLSTPVSTLVLDRLPTSTSGFTNLVFVGASLYWRPDYFTRKLNFRPNILAYWQQHATKKFDVIAKQSSTEYARNFLGTEGNFFFDIELFNEFKFFTVASVFVPGGHYTDIKGMPLTRDQQKILDKLDVTGVIDNLPLLGDDTAYTVNVGLEYRF
jgi:hypothetical protein